MEVSENIEKLNQLQQALRLAILAAVLARKKEA